MTKRNLLLLAIVIVAQCLQAFADTKSITDIYIRDPFIYADRASCSTRQTAQARRSVPWCAISKTLATASSSRSNLQTGQDYD